MSHLMGWSTPSSGAINQLNENGYNRLFEDLMM